MHAPEIRGREWDYVKECLDTEWVSTAGRYVNRFEEQLSEVTGVDHVIATVNGTSALQIALMAVGVSNGDEVIVPALTFVATANSVAHCGAIPHIVDIERETLGIDPEKLDQHLSEISDIKDGALINSATGRTIRAIVCVHTFGHPADLDRLASVSSKFGVPLIEDAAEALGSLYRDRHVGGVGKLSTLSFNGNKLVTTGGGGAVLTDDPDKASFVRHMTTTAKLEHPWEYIHDMVGYNYRLPNINAALGCAQLERLDDFVARKRELAKAYGQLFDAVEGIRFIHEPSGSRSNYWLNTVLLDVGLEHLRDPILSLLQEAKIYCRPAWRPMHLLPMYENAPRGDVKFSESVYARLINLPSSPSLHSFGSSA